MGCWVLRFGLQCLGSGYGGDSCWAKPEEWYLAARMLLQGRVFDEILRYPQ